MFTVVSEVIKWIFLACCGVLYVIGLCLGLSYKESSVVICIYLCPILCVMLAAACTAMSYNFKRFWNRISAIINGGLLLTYINLTILFWKHFLYTHFIEDDCGNFMGLEYGATMEQQFDRCVYDLQTIAHNIGICYETVNLIVYVVIFSSIVFFHAGQIVLRIIRKRWAKKKIAERRWHDDPNGYEVKLL